MTSSGNESGILSAFQDVSEPKAKLMLKSVRKLFINYSEESFRERLGSVKGNLHLVEVISIVTGQQLELPEVEREYYNLVGKSSRGDVIATLHWQDWKKAWCLPTSEKRTIYGAMNRIEVGGPAPTGLANFERGPHDAEPVFFHQMPSNFYKLLLDEHPLATVVDCTPGAVLFAIECVARKNLRGRARDNLSS